MKLNHRATIETLLERGATQREIARITGIDRKTVQAYQRRWHDARSTSSGVTTGNQPAVSSPKCNSHFSGWKLRVDGPL